MKKILSLTLVLAMLLTAVLAIGASAEVEYKYKLAIGASETGAPHNELGARMQRKLGDLAGVEITFEQPASDADSIINWASNYISAGYNGLLFYPSSDSMIPAIGEMCREAGVYFGFYSYAVRDPEVLEYVNSNEWYAGALFSAAETDGHDAGYNQCYAMIKYMGEKGYKKFCCVSVDASMTLLQTREQGIADAAADMGMELCTYARNPQQTSDCAAFVESFIAAYPDLDFVCYVGTTLGGAQEALVKAIRDSGKDIKFCAYDLYENMEVGFQDGITEYCVGTATLALNQFYPTAGIINKIVGTPVTEGPTNTTMDVLVIDSVDAAVKYCSIMYGEEVIESIYTEDQLKGFLKMYNPDLNADNWQETCNWTVPEN